jgi:hypothetical protein
MGDGAEKGPWMGREDQGKTREGPRSGRTLTLRGGGGAEAVRLEGSRGRSGGMVCGMARRTDLPCERQVIDCERDHVGEIPNQAHSSHLQS